MAERIVLRWFIFSVTWWTLLTSAILYHLLSEQKRLDGLTWHFKQCEPLWWEGYHQTAQNRIHIHVLSLQQNGDRSLIFEVAEKAGVKLDPLFGIREKSKEE